ncbi:RNA polymerase sigma factor [candidate division TA06 bacterium]|uniref:RNA polymerase sigma factor n=1 Tax=candidate division TA06 bacterium TaxID=2250710 RepID=A0A933ML76_UNCT6|nr:RNA polymerase sigma factor [candidate division TA06 bacterium]
MIDQTAQKIRSGPQTYDIKEVITSNSQAIYRLAYRLTGNVEDAKDLTQEVFIRAYKGLDNFKGQSEIKTWLYRIAINLGSSWRKKEIFSLISLDEISEPPAPDSQDSDTVRAVKKAVSGLPYRQRMVFVMRQYEGFKHEEIARITGRTEGSVKANYHQAVEKLKTSLKDLI